MLEVSKEISSEVKLDVELTEENTAELTVSYGGKMGGAKLVAYVSLAELVDKITDLIPGEWDDKILDGLAAKFLAKKTGE